MRTPLIFVFALLFTHQVYAQCVVTDNEYHYDVSHPQLVVDGDEDGTTETYNHRLTVTKNTDVSDADATQAADVNLSTRCSLAAYGTLRWAIQMANQLSGGVIITFQSDIEMSISPLPVFQNRIYFHSNSHNVKIIQANPSNFPLVQLTSYSTIPSNILSNGTIIKGLEFSCGSGIHCRTTSTEHINISIVKCKLTGISFNGYSVGINIVIQSAQTCKINLSGNTLTGLAFAISALIVPLDYTSDCVGKSLKVSSNTLISCFRGLEIICPCAAITDFHTESCNNSMWLNNQIACLMPEQLEIFCNGKASGYTENQNDIIELYEGSQFNSSPQFGRLIKTVNPIKYNNSTNKWYWILEDEILKISGRFIIQITKNNLTTSHLIHTYYDSPIQSNCNCQAPPNLSVTPTTFCEDGPSEAFTIDGVGFNGTITGNGVSSQNGVYTFDPKGISSNTTISIEQIYNTFTGCSGIKTQEIAIEPKFRIANLPSIICPDARNTPIQLDGSPNGGYFSGPGMTGSTFLPSAAGEQGTKTISYNPYSHLGSRCAGVSKKTYVYGDLPILNNVLSATSVTYSDNWPLDHLHNGVTPSNNLPSTSEFDFVTGAHKSVWRTDESYIYVTERKSNKDEKGNIRLSSKTTFSSTTNPIPTSGTFDQMPMFDWSNADMGACFPNWRKMNTLTQYHPLGYQQEDKDVISRYTAALYGYNGNLPVAQAANAKQNEVAFEGFEEYKNNLSVSKEIDLKGGNFTFFTELPTSTLSLYKELQILHADGSTLTLPGSLPSSLINKEVKLFGANLSKTVNSKETSAFNEKDIFGTFKIVSIAPDEENFSRSKVVVGALDNSEFPVLGLWRGKLSYYQVLSQPIINTPSGAVSITKERAHSGKQSLKVTANAEWQQVTLQMQPGKQYVLSAWVSSQTLGPTYQSPSTASHKRGIEISFKEGGTLIEATAYLEPKGDIIEGWQKIEGTFQVPASGQATVTLHVPSQQVDYYDDIRIHPLNASMQSYVYDPINLKLRAALDDNNYATFYYYDQEGNLFLTKKETERGIMTIQESFSHQSEK